MNNEFASMSIEELCDVNISILPHHELEAYHYELVVRKEQQELKLINLGVHPDTLSFDDTRYDLKQNVGLLSMLDNVLGHITG